MRTTKEIIKITKEIIDFPYQDILLRTTTTKELRKKFLQRQGLFENWQYRLKNATKNQTPK